MDHKQSKLENPIRLEELSPENTLVRIGLQPGHVFCDIGAGTGVFSIPAAHITRSSVYALEISDAMLDIIANKVKHQGLDCIIPIKVHGDDFGVPNGMADIILVCTVLHEISDKTDFASRAKRILKAQGKLAVIEFHKRQTAMGPPEDHRISREETEAVMKTAGLSRIDAFDLGDNLYCMVFQ